MQPASLPHQDYYALNIKRLAQSITTAIVFVSDKLSKQPNLPDRAEMAKKLAQEVGIAGETDFFRVAQYYENRFSHQALISKIKEMVSNPEISIPPALDQVAHLPVNTIITTAYDDLLKDAIRQAKRRANLIKKSIDLPYSIEGGVNLYKFYGDFDDLETLVVTRRDVRRFFRTHKELASYIQSLFWEHAFVFIGWTTDDPTFDQIYEEIAVDIEEHQKPAFVLTDQLGEFELEDLQKRGFTVLRNPNGLQAVLADLFNAIAEIKQPQNIPAVSSQIIGRDVEIQKILNLLQQQTNLPVLALGPAGVGKTTFAAHVARQWKEITNGVVLWYEITSSAERENNLINTLLQQTGGSFRLPQEEQDGPARFKEQIRQRRTLIVLDNTAANITAVQRLLPLADDPNIDILMVAAPEVRKNFSKADIIELKPLSIAEIVHLTQIYIPALNNDEDERLLFSLAEALEGNLSNLHNLINFLRSQQGEEKKFLREYATAIKEGSETLNINGTLVPIKNLIGATYSLLSAEEQEIFQYLAFLSLNGFCTQDIGDLAEIPLETIQTALNHFCDLRILPFPNPSGYYKSPESVQTYARETLHRLGMYENVSEKFHQYSIRLLNTWEENRHYIPSDNVGSQSEFTIIIKGVPGSYWIEANSTDDYVVPALPLNIDDSLVKQSDSLSFDFSDEDIRISMGKAISQAVFSGALSASFARAQAAAQAQNIPLLIHFKILAPELDRLPWELMENPIDQTHFTENFVVSRIIKRDQLVKPLGIQDELNVFTCSRGQLEQNETLSAIKEGNFQILRLEFPDEIGEIEAEHQLMEKLVEAVGQSRLRLVILEGVSANLPALHRIGHELANHTLLAGVVTLQFPLNASLVEIFNTEFEQKLRAGWQPEQALACARHEIYKNTLSANEGSIAWAAPVIYEGEMLYFSRAQIENVLQQINSQMNLCMQNGEWEKIRHYATLPHYWWKTEGKFSVFLSFNLFCNKLRADFSKGQVLESRFMLDCFDNCDFSHATLTDNDFMGCSFNNADFSRSKTVDVDFSGCELEHADFSRTTLKGVDFSGCTLSGADFSRAVLINLDFKDCDLSGAIFDQSNLLSVSFIDCNLSNVIFKGSSSTTLNILNSKLTGTDFNETCAYKVNIISFEPINIELNRSIWVNVNGVQVVPFDDPVFTANDSTLMNLNLIVDWVDWPPNNTPDKELQNLLTKIGEWLPELTLPNEVTAGMIEHLSQINNSPATPATLEHLQNIEAILTDAGENAARMLPFIKKAIRIATSLLDPI